MGNAIIRAILLVCLACVTPANADDLENSLTNLGTSLAGQLKERGVKKVAVDGFTDLNGYKSALGDFIAEELTTTLIAGGGLDVVERRELDRVLSELSTYSNGTFDPDTTAELQKLLGIDALITGSIANLGNRVKINARGIGVETAQSYAAGSFSLVKDETISFLLDQVSSSRANESSGGPSGFRVQSSNTFFRNSFLHVIPRGTSVSPDGDELSVSMEFRNVSNESLLLAVLRDSLSAISDAGDDFQYSSSNGIASLGRHNSKDDANRYSSIDPNSHAVVIWTFKKHRRDGKLRGNTFSFSGQLYRLSGSNATNFSVGLSDVEL